MTESFETPDWAGSAQVAALIHTLTSLTLAVSLAVTEKVPRSPTPAPLFCPHVLQYDLTTCFPRQPPCPGDHARKHRSRGRRPPADLSWKCFFSAPSNDAGACLPSVVRPVQFCRGPPGCPPQLGTQFICLFTLASCSLPISALQKVVQLIQKICQAVKFLAAKLPSVRGALNSSSSNGAHQLHGTSGADAPAQRR